MSTPTFLAPLAAKGAGQCELIHVGRGSVLAPYVEPAFDSKARRRGLLGRESMPEDHALIIAPCGSVHTFFMRFPIDVIFVSRDGTIVKTCRAVKPWRIAGAFGAFATIETAAGFIDRTETVPGDVVALREIPHTRRATDAPPPVPATPAPAGGGPTFRRTTPQRRVTLADVVSRKTPIGWFESVAIVQELGDAVLARGPADDLRVPELKHIVLTAAGGVELLGAGPADHSPVHRASLVLLALTPESSLPLQLRLLALEEVSPSPRFATFEAFHAELEFFERPNRREIVQGVRGRFLRQQAQAAAGGVPPPLLEPPPSRQRLAWWKRKWIAAVAAALVLALAAAAAGWEWRRPEGERFRQSVRAIIDASAAMTRRAAVAARDEIAAAQKKLGFGAKETVAPPPVTASGRAAAEKPSGRKSTGTPSGREGAGLPEQPTAVEPPPSPATPAVPAATGARSAPAQPPAQPDLLATETVFSEADPLVVPPRLLRPELRSVPPPGVRVEDLPEVELVVSAAGDVEAVRLVSPGTAQSPAMMLSAVKAWVFEPATRGGQPVRYRYRVRVPAR